MKINIFVTVVFISFISGNSNGAICKQPQKKQSAIQSMLIDHPKVDDESQRARFIKEYFEVIKQIDEASKSEEKLRTIKEAPKNRINFDFFVV